MVSSWSGRSGNWTLLKSLTLLIRGQQILTCLFGASKQNANDDKLLKCEMVLPLDDAI